MGTCVNFKQIPTQMIKQERPQQNHDLDFYINETEEWKKRQYDFEMSLISYSERQNKQEEKLDQNFYDYLLFQSEISYNEEEIQLTNQDKGEELHKIQQQQQIKLLIEKLPKQFREFYDKYGPYKPPDQQIQFVIGIDIITDDKSWYYGKIETKMKQGYGYHLTDNNFYEGFFKNNERNGCGRVINVMDVRYILIKIQSGYWQNNIIQRDMGMIYKNFQYKGQCENQVPHGYGELEQQEFIYKGYFYYGQKQGKGVLEQKNGNEKYEGEFYEDKFHGQGTLYYANGKIYTGNFKNDKPDGKGEMNWTLSENKYYQGDFVNGQREGKGNFRDSDNSVYEGEWKYDRKNGLGKLIKDGKEIYGKWQDGNLQEEEQK